MYKMRVVVWNLGNTGVESWIEVNLEHATVVGMIEGDVAEQILELSGHNEDWDFLLIFEQSAREQIDALLRKCGIEMEKVIYPLDMNSWVDRFAPFYYMMRDDMRIFLLYYMSSYKGDYVVTRTDDGISYIGRSYDEIINREIWLSGKNWAADTMETFYDLSQKYYSFSDEQKVFCDIGANIGTTCIYFKKKKDPAIDILAIEAVPEISRMLRANIDLNGLHECATICNVGVADKEGESSFMFHPNNPGGSSMVNKSYGSYEVTIRTTSFPTILEENGIHPSTIKYMWIDVEGAEAAFFEGAKEVLKVINAPVIMEFTPEWLNREGRLEGFVDDLASVYRGFIDMEDKQNEEHTIEELKHFLDNDERMQMDIFLLK